MEEAQQDVKMRILLSAKKLFAGKGYDGTSIREICEDANSNIALVSYYFGGKENVFLSLLEMYSPSSKLEKVKDDEDPAAALYNMVRAMIIYRVQHLDIISIIQQEIYSNSPRMPKIIEHTFPVWNKMKNILARGKEQGIFEYTSLDRTMLLIMALVIFPMKNPNLTSLLDEDALNTEDIIKDTYEFILRGLISNELLCKEGNTAIAVTTL
ncbi:MAG: TetR family transcriptional regulator [Bacillota bacterium]